MNRFLFFCFFSLACLGLHAQSIKEREVPQLIKKSVSEVYPEAKNISWEIEDGMYEASFMEAGKELTCVIAMNGKITQIEEEIGTSGLPGGALSYLAMHELRTDKMEVTKIKDARNTITYEIETEGMSYLFDERGNLISKQQEIEEDDDDR
jgi:hypothetical protein